MYASRRFVVPLFEQLNILTKLGTAHMKTKQHGISKRKQLMKNDNELDKDLEEFDYDLESDFTKFDQLHTQHKHEILARKERLQSLIVQQKYFKLKQQPNFLTWSDKEQIRHLHLTDPEKWSIEQLSEGFPALPDVIAKIASSSWRKNSQHKINRHDESVRQNWRLFKEKKLKDLPQELTEHLGKFTERALNFGNVEEPAVSQKKSKTIQQQVLKPSTEFSEIYRSYQRLQNEQPKDAVPVTPAGNKLDKPPEYDTYVIGANRWDKRPKGPHITLNALSERSKNLEITPGFLDNNDIKNVAKKAVVTDKNDEEVNSLNFIKNVEDTLHSSEIEVTKCVTKEKFNTKITPAHETGIKEVAEKSADTSDQFLAVEKYPTIDTNKFVKKMESSTPVLNYPERIRIPRELYKSGYTYKVNDCYYDDDGEFLYRVPGFVK